MRTKATTLSWMMLPMLALGGLATTSSDTRLVEAVKNKDMDAVRSLLSQHADLNAPLADGATALAWAAHWDNLETADLLIRAGAKVNAANNYGVTPLWEACNNRSAAMVEILAKAGGNPNAILPGTGETVLMRCARTGNADAVKSLLAHGANVDGKENKKGQTALMWALEERHLDVARELIEHGADVHAKTRDGFSPLLFAARQGALEQARLLIGKGADVNEITPGGLTPLLVAADSGHEQLAIFLVEQGANVSAADPDGFTALHYALRMGISILSYVGRGTGYPYSEKYLFRPNMTQLINVLLEHGANPNARILKGTKLTGNIAPGGGVVEVGLLGATPFLLAAAAGDIATMRTLMAKGADPKLGTNDGVTPLLAAAGVGRNGRLVRSKEEQKQSIAVIQMMLDLGADINASNQDGLTPVHGAAFSGANDVVTFLAEKGARLDPKDRYGQTPLSRTEADPNGLIDNHWRVGHRDTAELLRKLGGDPLAPRPEQATNAKQ
jgi:ankyrin repeat protein